MAGRTLHFHLAGINNQNFIMRDRETGTWWQQVSGEAIFGPLAGESLSPMPWDEVTFTVFRQEHPHGEVLLPAEEHREEYATADWEQEIAELPTVREPDPLDPLQPRDLVVGIAAARDAKAYRWTDLETSRLIADEVGGTPILILLHPDQRSLRCFDRRLEGQTLEMALRPGCPPTLIDRGTRSEWDFTGLATTGAKAGGRLARLSCLKDYWFDWKAYNPATAVFEGSLP